MKRLASRDPVVPAAAGARLSLTPPPIRLPWIEMRIMDGVRPLSAGSGSEIFQT